MSSTEVPLNRTADPRRRVQPAVDWVAQLGRLAWRHLRPGLAVITPLGRAVLAFGFACWVIGWRCGWRELMVIGTVAWLLLALAGLLTIGRTRLAVELLADPQRVVEGAPAAGAIRVRNTSPRPMLPIGLELPIGSAAARFILPLLQPGAAEEELFVVPTARRGVITVGPVSTVRGDPLGLLRRSVPWTGSLEIFVHPITVHLDPLGDGLLRDLEGRTTNDVSSSDLAFHALREYQPGDDRRHIHWRSSAKTGKFLVRQFLDTRRSHLCLLVDSHRESYADPEDYELAISAAASLTTRTVRDEQEVTVLAGEHAAPSATGSRALDIYARAELAEHGMADLARRANRIAPDLSMAILVTGSRTPFGELQRTANEFPFEVRVLALRVDPTRATGISSGHGMTVMNLRRLGDLASLFRGAV